MSNWYPINAERLESLRATRAGRISLDGFEYQRAFAVLRLASLALRRPVAGAGETPIWIRYEWGEDIDELAEDKSVILWQCKRGEGWNQPAKIIEVLEGFAPKWLWTPENERGRLQFRLVTSDPAFAAAHDLAVPLPAAAKCKAETAFLNMLAEQPGERSDRGRWQIDANQAGHGALFAALWQQTTVLYMSGQAQFQGGIAIRHAEDRAVHELAKGRKIRDASQASRVIADLQALLTTLPPGQTDANGLVAVPSVPPEVIQPGDVDARLFCYGPSEPESPPFAVVDRTFLARCRSRPRPAPFIARRPEWSDVVRGRDTAVRFLERACTDIVQSTVSEALQTAAHGEGPLQVQLITGAPGSGKSTLALRVATKLVEAGSCIVADARYRLSIGEEFRGIVDCIRRLATGGRPVLLLLDDPLGGDSGWPQLLSLLSRGTARVVVLAATPDFLFERHKAKLEGLRIHPPIVIGKPAIEERQEFASLHPEPERRIIVDNDEELLVLAMDAAAGETFDEIIDRIWLTLADQRMLGPETLGEQMPWQVAVLHVVAFFHRAYVGCPEPLLNAILANRSDVGEHAIERLENLRQGNGWRIFRVDDSGQGATIFTMHARVADKAWLRRPVPAWNVGITIARASTFVPQLAPKLGLTLAAFFARRLTDTTTFLQALAEAWCAGEVRNRIETRRVAELSDILHNHKIPDSRALFRAELMKRAGAADAQSWLALLQLFHESSSDPNRRAFPPRLTISLIVQAADFSSAPEQVPFFARALAGRPEDLVKLQAKLWGSFDEGSIDNLVLAWLIGWGAPREVTQRLGDIRSWLMFESADIHVRVAFVAWLTIFPTEATNDDIPSLLEWVRAHPEEHSVCAKFISFLNKVHAPELGIILSETVESIGVNPNATEVAIAALAAAAQLGANKSALIARWLAWVRTFLSAHEGNLDAQPIATATEAPHRTLQYYLRTNQVPEADQATVTVVLQETPELCQRWYRSVSLPCRVVFS